MISVGTTKDITIPKGERIAEVSVGKTTGLLQIPLEQIEEEHLSFRVKVEVETKEYEVTIRRSGPVLLKAKLGDQFEKMTSSESFSDAEIKENGGLRFRLGDRVRDDEMKMFVEIGLNWDIEKSPDGKHSRKKFFITIEKIQGEISKTAINGLYKLIDTEDDFY